jgi:3',5'-nucleoside bisphosphate phosphatase
MMVTADLHIHTTASDGLLHPAAVVKMAMENGLAAIAITDHDAVNGIDEALAAAQAGKTVVIPGIELSSEMNGREIHMLGYYLDHTYPPLLSLTKTIQDSRFERAERMIAGLNILGYTIDLPSVMVHAKEAAPGRPHVARALVDKGYFASVKEVFTHLLAVGKPGYVERYRLTPQESIAIIREAGGMAVWAHPALSRADSLLEGFVRQGLAGLEIYHPDHLPEHTARYRTLARKYNLIVTGGSDFHGREAGRVRDLAYCGLNSRELELFFAAFVKKKHKESEQ